MKSLRIGAIVASILCVAASNLWAQGWGDVKGTITVATTPAKKEIKPNKDQAHCLEKGTLFDDDLVVDAKTKGLRNVMIWLAPVAGNKMAIHPDLAKVPSDRVIIDQPCCLFVPRVSMLREGQTLEIKNSAPVLHNAKLVGSATGNGTINVTIPPGQSITKQLRAEKRPMYLGCDIHAWMGGRIGVFNHPYFALTTETGSFEIKKAPAGKYKIFMQHEKLGWIHAGQSASGQDIEIKPNGALDLGKLTAKVE